MIWCWIGNGDKLHAFPIRESDYALCGLGGSKVCTEFGEGIKKCKICTKKIEKTIGFKTDDQSSHVLCMP
jgi:hypothetical protein